MFNSSGTSQKAEQQTSNATGFKSVAAGKKSTIQQAIFGAKNLARPDYAKPAFIIAGAGLIAIWILKGGRRGK